MTATNQNNIRVSDGTADIEISDGTNAYGFLGVAQTILETRGSAFSGQISSGAPTYQDATPFQRIVWETFGGGFGQVQQNKTFGGISGQGGDSAHYYYADAYTPKSNILMPGMYRKLAHNDSGSTSPVDDIYEIPRGVIPVQVGSATGLPTAVFTVSANVTIQKLQMLVKFTDNTLVSSTLTVTMTGFGIASTDFTATVVQATSQNYIGMKWVQLTAAGAINLSSGKTYSLTCSASSIGVAVGCFVQNNGVGPITNMIEPYFQLIKNGTSNAFKYWTDNIRKTELVRDPSSGSPGYICLTDTTLFNPLRPDLAERSLGGTYQGSFVFDNNVYVTYKDGGGTYHCDMWNYVASTTNAAATSTTTLVAPRSATIYAGKIYFTEAGTPDAISKWDGVYPPIAGAGAGHYEEIIPTGSIGKKNTNGTNPINTLIAHAGYLFAFKPEGVYWIYAQIDTIVTGTLPQIISGPNLFDLEEANNGLFVIELTNVLYFNVRNLIYQLTTSTQGNSVNVIAIPNPVLTRYTGTNYVTGLSTDGQSLFVAFNNVGILQYKDGGWHSLCEFYEYQTTNKACGLRVVPANTSSALFVWCGDGKEVIKLTVPSFTDAAFNQISLGDQNRCFYWITSFVDADLAEITKYVRSFLIRGAPQGFNYKLVAVTATNGAADGSYRRVIDIALNQGLSRDMWVNWHNHYQTQLGYPVVTTNVLDALGATTAGTIPGYWQPSDFNTPTFTSEKLAAPTTTDPDTDLTNSFTMVSGAFILYGWIDPATQTTNANSDPSYIEALVMKYLAPLAYVGMFRITVDIQKLIDEPRADLQLTLSKLYDAVTFLRQKFATKAPVRFTYRDPTKVQGSVNGNFPPRTIQCYLTNPQYSFNYLRTARGEPVPMTISFTALSIEEEVF